MAVYAAIGLRFGPRPIFLWGIITPIAICASTIFTKQHDIADVVTGAMLAALMAFAITRRPKR